MVNIYTNINLKYRIKYKKTRGIDIFIYNLLILDYSRAF